MMLLGLVIAAALLATAVLYYNRLVRSRNRVRAAWSDIDVQLQRRHDLVPPLVKAVDQYANYERATLEAVTALRSEAMRATELAKKGAAEENLSVAIGKLIAIAENYPDLKASENFLRLQQELVETENYLQFARRYYNASVRDYNTLTASVPSNIIARLFHFPEEDFFQKAADDVVNVPLVKLGSVE